MSIRHQHDRFRRRSFRCLAIALVVMTTLPAFRVTGAASVSLTIRIEPGIHQMMARRASTSAGHDTNALVNALLSCRSSLADRYHRDEVDRIMQQIVNRSVVVSGGDAWLTDAADGSLILGEDGMVSSL